MPRFRITEAVSLRRVKNPQFFSLEQRRSSDFLLLLRRPAHQSTPPTVPHTSDAPAHRVVTWAAAASPAPSRSLAKPLEPLHLLLLAIITNVHYAVPFSLPAMSLHALSRRLFWCHCHCLRSIPRSLVCLFLQFGFY